MDRADLPVEGSRALVDLPGEGLRIVAPVGLPGVVARDGLRIVVNLVTVARADHPVEGSVADLADLADHPGVDSRVLAAPLRDALKIAVNLVIAARADHPVDDSVGDLVDLPVEDSAVDPADHLGEDLVAVLVAHPAEGLKTGAPAPDSRRGLKKAPWTTLASADGEEVAHPRLILLPVKRGRISARAESPRFGASLPRTMKPKDN